MRRGRSGSLRTWIVSRVPSGAHPSKASPRRQLYHIAVACSPPAVRRCLSRRGGSLRSDLHRCRQMTVTAFAREGRGLRVLFRLPRCPGPLRSRRPGCFSRAAADSTPPPVARCRMSRRPTSRRRVAPTTVATCARRDRDGAFPPGCPGHELRRYPQDPFAVRLFRAVRRGPPCASPVRPRLPETVPRHPDLFRSPSSRGGSSAPSGRPPRSTVRSRRLPVLLRYRPVRAVASADFRVFLHRRVRCVIRPCELDDARSFHGFVSRSRSSPPSAGASALAGVRSPVRSCGAGPSCLGPTRPSYGSVRGLGS